MPKAFPSHETASGQLFKITCVTSVTAIICRIPTSSAFTSLFRPGSVIVDITCLRSENDSPQRYGRRRLARNRMRDLLGEPFSVELGRHLLLARHAGRDKRRVFPLSGMEF